MSTRREACYAARWESYTSWRRPISQTCPRRWSSIGATLSLWDLVTVVALSFDGHILINDTAYSLGIRDVKW
jgi:hypothetical protein